MDSARAAFYAKIDRMDVENEPLDRIEAKLTQWANDKRMLEYFAKMKEDRLWYEDNRDLVDAGALEWRMLLRVESNQQVGLWWWDAGFIELMIRNCDLRTLCFDDTHMTLFSM